MVYLCGRHGHRFVTVFTLHNEGRRVRRSVNIDINVELWWGRRRLAVGRGRRLDRRLEFRSRSRGALFHQTEHFQPRPFVLSCLFARVGDLTRQADLDNLVLCRRRLAPSQGNRSCSATGPANRQGGFSRISIWLMRSCIQGLPLSNCPLDVGRARIRKV